MAQDGRLSPPIGLSSVTFLEGGLLPAIVPAYPSRANDSYGHYSPATVASLDPPLGLGSIPPGSGGRLARPRWRKTPEGSRTQS